MGFDVKKATFVVLTVLILCVFVNFTDAASVSYQQGVSGGAYANTDDCWLHEDMPDNGNGMMDSLRLNYGTGTMREVLIAFRDMVGPDEVNGQIPLGSTITSAVLKIRNKTNMQFVYSWDVYVVLKDWANGSEGTEIWSPIDNPGEFDTTWNNATDEYDAGGNLLDAWAAPGLGAGTDRQTTPIFSGDYTFDGDWAIIDITSAVQQWADGQANYGVLIVPSESQNTQGYSSNSTTSAYRPILQVEYTPPALTQCGGVGTVYLDGDLNGDCYVDSNDIAFMVGEWLQESGVTSLSVSTQGQGTIDWHPAGTLFNVDESVVIAASAEIGWHFDHWQGDLGEKICAVEELIMDTSKNVTAVFVQDVYAATVGIEGGNVVARDGSGILMTQAPVGVDDSSIINAAISSVGSGGGYIQVQAGTYLIKTTINLASNTHLVGVGPATILKQGDYTGSINPHYQVVNASFGQNMSVSHLDIDGNWENNPGHGDYWGAAGDYFSRGGIKSWSTNNLLIYDVNVYNINASAIKSITADSNPIQNVRFLDCVADGTRDSGFGMQGNSGPFTGGIMYNCQSRGAEVDAAFKFRWSGLSDCKAVKCKVSDLAGAAMYWAYPDVTDVEIRGCDFQGGELRMGFKNYIGTSYVPMGDGLISDSIINATDIFFYSLPGKKTTVMSDVTLNGNVVTDGTSVEYVAVTPPATADKSDINIDGRVDLVDFSLLAKNWMDCTDPAEPLCD